MKANRVVIDSEFGVKKEIIGVRRILGKLLALVKEE